MLNLIDLTLAPLGSDHERRFNLKIKKASSHQLIPQIKVQSPGWRGRNESGGARRFYSVVGAAVWIFWFLPMHSPTQLVKLAQGGVRPRGCSKVYQGLFRCCRRVLVEGNRVKCAGSHAWRVEQRLVGAARIRQHAQVYVCPRFCGVGSLLPQLSWNEIGISSLIVSSICSSRPPGRSHVRQIPF